MDAVALILLIALAFSADWLAEDLALIPYAATYAIEALIALLAIRAMWVRWPHRPRGTRVVVPAAILLVGGTASALLNAESLWSIALGARVLFRFVVLYYALLNLDLPERWWQRTVTLCLALVLLQIPIGLYQFWVLGRTDDEVFGSLRSTGSLVLVSAAALCVLAARYIWYKPSILYLVAIPLFFLLPVFGEAKGFFFLIPVPMAILLALGWRADRIRTLVTAAIFSLSATVAVVFYGAVGGNADLLPMFSRASDLARFVFQLPERAHAGEGVGRRPPKAWDERVNNPPEVAIAASMWPRLEAIRHAFDSVTTRPTTAVLGFGIGSRTFTRDQVEHEGAEILYVSPMARRLYETGFAGIALYGALLTVTALSARPTLRSPDRLWQATAAALPSLVVLYGIAELYTETLLDAPALTFWVLAAAAVQNAYRKDADSAGKLADA
jgi:hypothetical protein